jgi:hypothetical protein
MLETLRFVRKFKGGGHNGFKIHVFFSLLVKLIGFKDSKWLSVCPNISSLAAHVMIVL